MQKQLEVSEQDAKGLLEEHFLEPPSELFLSRGCPEWRLTMQLGSIEKRLKRRTSYFWRCILVAYCLLGNHLQLAHGHCRHCRQWPMYLLVTAAVVVSYGSSKYLLMRACGPDAYSLDMWEEIIDDHFNHSTVCHWRNPDRNVQYFLCGTGAAQTG